MATKKEVKPASSALIAGDRIILSERGPSVAVGRGQGEDRQAPSIEIIRQGELIQAIDVTCTCGSKMRILCEYA